MGECILLLRNYFDNVSNDVGSAENIHLCIGLPTFYLIFPSVGYGDICPSNKLSNLGRLFIVSLSFCGLGFFCGPIMDFASAWTKRIPGGAIGPGLCALAMGMLLFMQIEEMSAFNAIYLTIITGTTVGYGDLGPITEMGRLSTALL